jgi:hypothetical protein
VIDSRRLEALDALWALRAALDWGTGKFGDDPARELRGVLLAGRAEFKKLHTKLQVDTSPVDALRDPHPVDALRDRAWELVGKLILAVSDSATASGPGDRAR